MLNKDYKDILLSLLKHQVKFLVVGAYAMAGHGYPRATGDIDFWVEPSPKNAKKVYQALLEFGAPKQHFEISDFKKKGNVLQIGVAPRRIDIITEISGVDFETAWNNRLYTKFGKIKCPILNLKELIKNKKSTGRDKDKADYKTLIKMAKNI